MIVRRIPNELYHHGIKGQKWGVRRYQNADGSLTSAGMRRYKYSKDIGNGLYVMEHKKGAIATLLSRNPKIKKEQNKTLSYDVFNENHKVGNIELYLQNKNTMYINWIDVSKKERGKKYAQTMMDYIINESKKKGVKYITLEVPGNSPDARHIYEKKGFVDKGKLYEGTDDIWEGLTKMKKTL